MELQDFIEYFGDGKFADVWGFYWINWNDPKQKPRTEFIGGAFTSFLKPKVWTDSGRLGWREPVGSIFWVGTEVSDRWPGYFDGAIHAEGGRTESAELYLRSIGAEHRV
jgi:monoamine oxidase